MAIEIRYESNGQGVVLLATGVLTGGELIAAVDEIYANEKLSRLRYQIADFNGVERVEVSSTDIRALAERDRKAATRVPRMVVVSVGEQDIIYGLNRMWEALVDDADLRTNVFRTLPEARSWLADIFSPRADTA